MNLDGTSSKMTTGLPQRRFTCATNFRDEFERIFNRHWIAVCHLSDFAERTVPPGEPGSESCITVQYGDCSVVVVLKADGDVAAFHNVCRHRGTRLVDKPGMRIKNNCLTCPYHAWSYNTDGDLIGAPNMKDVEGFDRADFGLFPVTCSVWGGIVFLHLENPTAEFGKDMEPLVSRMANWQMDSLAVRKSLRYSVKANWKLLFQNYSECYHCPTVHPDLNEQTPYKTASNDLLNGPILGGPMELAEGFETISQDGKAVSEPFSGLDERQKRSIYYYTVCPNLFVSAHPDYVMIHLLTPVDVDRTEVSCHFLVNRQTTDGALQRAWKMWHTVNQQDWTVCELTQAGVTSPAYQPGPYSNLESMLAAFDQHYLELMDPDSHRS